MYSVGVSFKILVTEMRNASTHSWHDAACWMDEMVDGARHDTAALGFHHQPCHGSEDGYYFSWRLSTSLDAGWLAIFKYVQPLCRRLLRVVRSTRAQDHGTWAGRVWLTWCEMLVRKSPSNLALSCILPKSLRIWDRGLQAKSTCEAISCRRHGHTTAWGASKADRMHSLTIETIVPLPRFVLTSSERREPMFLGRKPSLVSSMAQRVVVGDEWPSRGAKGAEGGFHRTDSVLRARGAQRTVAADLAYRNLSSKVSTGRTRGAHPLSLDRFIPTYVGAPPDHTPRLHLQS